MHYPQIDFYKKILYGLLAIHLLIAAFMLYGVLFYQDSTAFWASVGLAISIFYLVLLITLINYVVSLDERLGMLIERLIHLEHDVHPDKLISGSAPSRHLSDRLGKL